MVKSNTNLPDLINQWVEDYSENDFIEQFMPNYTFGDIVWFMYEVGEIPSTAIEAFLNEGEDE